MARNASSSRYRIRNRVAAFGETVLTGEVAEHSFAGRDEASDRALDSALMQWQARQVGKPVGQAYLVGAGPGDPQLLTMRGHHLLANADAVLYDRLVNPKILEYARRDAEKIPVGKTAGKPSMKQIQINRLIVSLVSAGKRVCRLKGGDPMIFGRAGEELEALKQAGLPFQIVPGISAVEGCAAYAGIPLTLRGSAQAILITTGHTRDHVSADLSTYQPGQTLALYMAVAQFEAIAAELIINGHRSDTALAIVENGTLETQRVIRATLGTLAAISTRYGVQSPALLLVGDTVRYADRYSWFNPNLTNIESGDTERDLAQVS